MEALVRGLIAPRDRRAIRQAREFATICVTFLVGGVAIASEDTTSPYAQTLDTTTLSDGDYTLTAIARDTALSGVTISSCIVAFEQFWAGALFERGRRLSPDVADRPAIARPGLITTPQKLMTAVR